MPIRSPVDMVEATRLTREGKLQEAMAVLRGALAGARRSAGADKPERETDARRPTLVDMVPPSTETGAWTAPPFEGFAAQSGDGVHPRAPTPRSILDRLRALGSRIELDGLVARPGRPRPVPLPEGATFEAHNFADETGARSYKLYVPSRYRGEAAPLVLMLHGCTQSPDDFAAGTRMNELAEEQVFLVAYPAQTQSANPSKCWNWFNGSDQRRDRGEPALIAGITRQVMRDFAIEPRRVYVAGLSAGGAAAAIMGTAYPDLYAAIGVHSGLACGAAHDMPSAFAAMRQGGGPAAGPSHRRRPGLVPTIVFHGDGDKTVNPINGDEIIAQAKAAMNLTSTVERGRTPGGMNYTRTVQSDAAGRAMLEQWVLHGGGHAWSGGSKAGSFTEPRGPDASREMVRFFLQSRLG